MDVMTAMTSMDAMAHAVAFSACKFVIILLFLFQLRVQLHLSMIIEKLNTAEQPADETKPAKVREHKHRKKDKKHKHASKKHKKENQKKKARDHSPARPLVRNTYVIVSRRNNAAITTDGDGKLTSSMIEKGILHFRGMSYTPRAVGFDFDNEEIDAEKFALVCTSKDNTVASQFNFSLVDLRKDPSWKLSYNPEDEDESLSNENAEEGAAEVEPPEGTPEKRRRAEKPEGEMDSSDSEFDPEDMTVESFGGILKSRRAELAEENWKFKFVFRWIPVSREEVGEQEYQRLKPYQHKKACIFIEEITVNMRRGKNH